jgi:hypothetical protein
MQKQGASSLATARKVSEAILQDLVSTKLPTDCYHGNEPKPDQEKNHQADTRSPRL